MRRVNELGRQIMKAMIYDRYGDKDVLQTEAFDLSSIKLRRFRRTARGGGRGRPENRPEISVRPKK